MGERFETTRWSLVLAARDETGGAARRALAWLCEAYWYPVYAFIRHRGHGPDEAADLTQGYFARLLEKDYLGDVQPELGKFRSFLLKSVQHYLSNEHDRARAVKRGAGRRTISLDGLDPERRLSLEPHHDLTPEAEFERLWALELLERVMASLGREAAARGRSRQFELLRSCLTDTDSGPTYQDVARQLKVGESAVKVAVHRLRRRFGALLRAEIAETVADPTGIDAEIRHLFVVLGQRRP